MTEQVQVDFIQSRAVCEVGRSPGEVLDRVVEGQRGLLGLLTDEILDLLQAFGEKLLERSNPLHGRYLGAGLPYIAAWCRRNNLNPIVRGAIHPVEALDGWVLDPARKDRELRAFPRGMAVHWMAGNVPTLGFLSLLMGLLTKNANVVKVASESDRLLADLLEQLALTELDSGLSGRLLTAAVSVVRYDHSWTAIGSAFSQRADVRVVWGGNESVAFIRNLPHKPDVLDLGFPSRTSFMIIGGAALSAEHLDAVAGRAARDISIFEQKACASPHTIFLITQDKDIVNAFAQALKRGLQNMLRSLPKMPPSEKEVSAILNLRAQYDMFHEAWYSSGTEYTILADDKTILGTPVGSRTVWLRQLHQTTSLANALPENVQSVGLAVDDLQREELTDLLGMAGVHRFTRVGSMTNFELPWDGHFIPQALVRWTSRPGKGF